MSYTVSVCVCVALIDMYIGFVTWRVVNGVEIFSTEPD